MALEGTIKEFGLADIFQLIGLQKKTGILFLKGIDETVNVHFEDGMVVKVDESQKRHKYLLGRILVNRGIISEPQLKEALDTQKSTAQKLGGVLISAGFIDKDDLRDALSFQINEAVYKVFRWKGGDYKFDQERVDYDRDTIVPLSTEHILMDGIRMLDEWPQIEETLPDMQVVLSRKDISSGSSYEEGDIFAGFGEEKDTGLSKDTEHVIGLIDGKKSVVEVIEMSMLGEFDTCKTIVSLLKQGMVTTTDAKSALISQEMPSLKIKHAPSSASALDFILGKLVYLFVIAAVLVSFNQLTGTRKIMDPHEPKLENLKKPFTVKMAKKVGNSISGYFFVFGVYPESLASLEQIDYIDREDLSDPWGNNLKIATDPDGNNIVYSAGLDGTFGTGDDILSTP